MPKKACDALEEQGIDLSGIDELIRTGETLGVLLEVKKKKKKKRLSYLSRDKSKVVCQAYDCQEAFSVTGLQHI